MSHTAHSFLSIYVEAVLNAFRRKPDLSSRQAIVYLVIAVVLTLVIPPLQGIVEQRSGVSQAFLILPFLGISSGAAFYLFAQERIKVGLVSLLMFVFGILLATVSFMMFTNQGGATYRGDFSSISAVVSIFNQSVITPFYEELTVRTFLFFGVARYLGFVFAAITVSVLFGLVHGQISVFAFSVSMLLCYLAYRNVGVFDRTVLHGSYNLALIIMVVMLGRA